MFTARTNSGCASKFFLNDPKKCIAIIQKPYIVFSNNILNNTALAEILVVIYNSLPGGLFGLGVRKLSRPQMELFLDDLGNQRKPQIPFPEFKQPVLILSGGFDKNTLTAIKILKIRGICQMLAVDVSVSLGDLSARLDAEFSDNKIEEKTNYRIYKPDNKLNVVSGLGLTVFSTENTVEQLLKNFPQIISDTDLAAMPEEL